MASVYSPVKMLFENQILLQAERGENMLTKKRKEEIIEDYSRDGHGPMDRFKVTIVLKPVVIKVLSAAPIDLMATYPEIKSDKEAEEIAIGVAIKEAVSDLICEFEISHQTREWLQEHIKKIKGVRTKR